MPQPVRPVAALYVDPNGTYAGAPGVDPWGPERDARGYRGPYPVVAHPPCTRWCQLASVVEARYGYPAGEDNGEFAAALEAVRRWGGVLEHPAWSLAWPAFDLTEPPQGGWQRCLDGGWVTHVEQGMYGHPARKATWLYAFGVEDPPPLRWGSSGRAEVLVSWNRNHTDPNDTRRRIGKREAAATPPAFRDVLLEIARRVAE